MISLSVLSRLWRPPANSCLALNRPWRQIINYCPVLTQPRRLPLNSQPYLSHPRMLSVNFLTGLLRLQGPFRNSSSLPTTAMETLNELSLCPVNPVNAKETISEQSVCPISPHVSELELSDTSREPGSERSILRSETIDAPHLCPGGPVTAIESTHELSACCVIQNVSNSESSGPPVSVSEPVYKLSTCPVSVSELVYKLPACPVSVSEPVYKLSACPVSVREHIEEFVFPASILDAVNALLSLVSRFFLGPSFCQGSLIRLVFHSGLLLGLL